MHKPIQSLLGVTAVLIAQMVPTVTQSALPSTRPLYGHPSYAVATPFPTACDNYYSGANSRPARLTDWYGNGYNW
jgi:hypothetical protein